jgi:hypothetical protein
MSQEYKLLERLYPFFTGEYNHHDIMLIGNCSHGKLEKMMTKYSAVLERFWFS